jgi:hypothetical protein
VKPKIDKTRFGAITVESVVYRHDVVICPDGEVQARANGLSKEVYGTSHMISLAEARHVYQEGVERLIVGTGLTGLTKLSDEAAAFFRERGCRVDRYATRRAIKVWNEAEGAVIGLFHITC